MSGIRQRCDQPYWATFVRGQLSGTGETKDGFVCVDRSEELRGYATRGERESDLLISVSKRALSLDMGSAQVEEMKSPQAYAGKADDARRLLAAQSAEDGTPADPALYPWLSVDCEECGVTGFAAATAVMAAIQRDGGAIETERARIRLREKTRQLKNTNPGLP